MPRPAALEWSVRRASAARAGVADDGSLGLALAGDAWLGHLLGLQNDVQVFFGQEFLYLVALANDIADIFARAQLLLGDAGGLRIADVWSQRGHQARAFEGQFAAAV